MTEAAPSPSDGAPAEESGADRRVHKRVEAPLKARFLTASGEERACLVVNISAGGALLRAKEPPKFGEDVVLYIDLVGRFEAQTVRSTANSFAVVFRRKRNKNAKTADAITEALNRDRRRLDRRTTPRIAHDAPAQIFLEDGRRLNCAILDISLTGASIEISPRPPLGARMIIGRMNAKVVRRHEKGVGVVFTGAATRMEDVIEQAVTAPEEPAPQSPRPAFGKKPPTAGN